MKPTNSSEDLVSRLLVQNHHQVLENIFLSLSLQDLRCCRMTCKTWLAYLRQELWAGRSRRALEDRLEQHWRKEKHRRVQLTLHNIENCTAQARSHFIRSEKTPDFSH